MYIETVDHFAARAAKNRQQIRKSLPAFLVASLMAGAYVGIGIVLIFIIGSSVDPAFRKLVMGATFGIALTLVVFAGAELFTGHTMYTVLGRLRRSISTLDLIAIWLASWLGNLAGSVLLAALFFAGGGGGILDDPGSFLFQVASYKMNSAAGELVARGILCNWLVCLALWMSARTSSDAAKCILIFWCLLAFIASGFEHSVANMTLLSLAMLGNHPDTVSFLGMAHNLFWVTIGNIIGGAFFMAMGYWLASDRRTAGDTTARPKG